jgi:hypothetical protein
MLECEGESYERYDKQQRRVTRKEVTVSSRRSRCHWKIDVERLS